MIPEQVRKHNAESSAKKYRPELVVMGEESAAGAKDHETGGPRVRTGIDGLVEAASMPEADIVLNGLSGAIGLRPSLAALQNGRRLALANKESLVMAGPLMMDAASNAGAEIIPVDSEHSAVFYCLGGQRDAGPEVVKIWLTASGGPFRDWPAVDIRKATRAEPRQEVIYDALGISDRPGRTEKTVA